VADNPHGTDPSDLPEAVAVPRSRRTVQLVWLIPLLAALVGGWLAVKSIMDRGPEITISFDTGEGIEAGKTKIRFKDVEVGLVKTVVLAKDKKRVIVTAELVKGSEPDLVEDTRFWVVRPRISGGSVSGLGTLLSGSYIGADFATSGKATREFIGLGEPPAIGHDMAGREFVLRSDDIGSLDTGSPVYFRRLQAGRIASYELDKDGKGVTLKVFVNAPYDKYVNANTRFWHASGVDLTLDANGVKLDTQSVVSILIGGLAFETPLESADLPQAAAGTGFRLFVNRAEALKNPDMDVIKVAMVFSESVRGLVVGAPVDFLGIDIGAVTAIKAQVNETTRRIDIVIEADVYPARLRTRSVTKRAALSAKERISTIDAMVGRGLRAQLRTGSLLTGQLYVALEFVRDAPKAKLRTDGALYEIPTIPSSITEIQETIASIAKKIHAFPLEQIGADLHQTLQSATRMMDHLDGDLKELTPETKAVLVEARKALVSADRALKPDSPLSGDARDAMREIARAAASFRALADYLERHPEALISGKKEEK
jgi:paraquat-inducible protein B